MSDRPPTEREDLTPDQMLRCARFLFGASDEAEKQGQASLVVPIRTARAIARAVVGALNAA